MPQSSSLILKGRCWLFGDNLGCDGDMMPFEFALAREIRPEILRDHAMTGVDPDFPKKAKPGDIIIAGRRFGQGNPHIQCFIGLRALGLGAVVESIPRGSLRNAINAGMCILPECRHVTGLFADGDNVEVDFGSGVVANLTKQMEYQYPPLPPPLLGIIELGGWEANFAARLAQRKPALHPPNPSQLAT
jgi:3-isopropylmalate/(R)-2-methylmalate dehydratase small subunit